ncbi:MAG: AAA family ATPase, partial [Candidatus Thorarchaeota archaeon]
MPEQRVLLKSVKLKGFLSFREGTVEFSPGLNVVVGPNGSGKSSIFHAIKFALGSNQREGRYERWSGFVRHGEDSAYVEVTVEVEGKEKRLGRKIDRDGVPRCYVDGRIVKAGVLRSEVERLGFNVDNTLVFMPQERINALRDLDPIEVRNLVEEGTGLAVMRDQIADQQMLISHDSEILESTISERTLVEHELQLIQRDLQRLFRKRQLLDTRVKLQLELQWASLDELVSLEMRLMDEIDRHKEGLSSLAREIQAVESDMASYQKQQNVIQERIESVQQEIGAIKTLLEERGKQLSDTRGKNERSLAELRHLQQSIREAESRISEFSGQLKRISADKERLSDMRALRSSEMSALQAELEKVERDLEAYSEWNEKRTEAQTRHREILAEMRALEAEHRALVRSMQRDQAELDEIMRRWGHIWTILERADRSDLERKRTTLQSEVTRYDRTLYELRSEMDRLQRESQDLHTRLQETSGHVPESVLRLKEAIRDHGLNDVVGPLLDMLPCDSEYARALDAVLMGDLPFSFIVRERADFLLLERLRDKYNAPSPVILIQERDEHPPLPDSQGVIGWLWDLVTADES